MERGVVGCSTVGFLASQFGGAVDFQVGIAQTIVAYLEIVDFFGSITSWFEFPVLLLQYRTIVANRAE